MTRCAKCGWFFKDLEDWHQHQLYHMKQKPKDRYKAPYRKRYRENGRSRESRRKR